VALRLLHFADLHLDRSFAAERLFGAAGQRRREDLRASLQRIVERAQAADCDLITCAGGLFDHERVTRETASFALEALGGAGRPVLIAPGDDDPAVPSSPYRYLRWPANVTIASHEELRPYPYGEVTCWAAGSVGAKLTEAPLRSFARLGAGVNLLLLHASDTTDLPEGQTPYAQLDPARVREVGFAHALLGHYQQARTGHGITYPGSPEPLSWDDSGRHCVAIVNISDEGRVEVALEDINQRRFLQESIDITGMTSRDQVRDAILAMAAGGGLEGALFRVTLVGERSRSLDLDPQALSLDSVDGFAYLEFVDRTHHSHDLDGIAQEFTSRGEMLRKLVDRRQNSAEESETVKSAIQLGLDAFEA
jgi:DNA repair exonuclease SbcCD nuclease subunit